MTQSSKPTLAERFARFTNDQTFERLPVAVVHEVKRRVIDSVGCALGAWDQDPSVISRKVAGDFSAAKNGATLWGTKHVAPADWAAFANGIMVRYLDFNDTYLSKEPAHPSDNIPATISAAESAGATGKDVITAVAIAYEIQCRLADAASIRSRGWDHVTYGAFSTAAAAAKVFRLDFEKTRQAINIGGVASAALRQSRVGELSHWKGVAFANAARQGVYSALLARAGMTGPSPIFEGEKGFEKLVSGPLDVKGPFESATPPAGFEDFMILKTSIKYWPVEYHAQSAVTAAMNLRQQAPDWRQIESVLIESHDAAVDIIGSEPEKWRPENRETADHSLPYLTAVALVDGVVDKDQFTTARMTDDKLLEFVSRVKVVRHKELSDKYPGVVGNIVTLKLKDGRTIVERSDFAKGHARNPLSDAELEKKYVAQAEPLLGRARSQSLLEWLWKLDAADNLKGMMPLIEVP